MPQLVKGGKHVFGWARVGASGRIVIPPEAVAEYGLREGQRLPVLPGSRTSGGFALGSPEAVRGSVLGAVLKALPARDRPETPEGELFEHAGRSYAWVMMERGFVRLAPRSLARYGVQPGDRVLVIRGSGLAVGLVVRGPIVREARAHAELAVFE